MSSTNTVLRNQYGGLYQEGKAFTASEWHAILDKYLTTCQIYGKCSVRTLAKKAKVSKHSAHKCIKMFEEGMNSMPVKKRGHNKKGIGMLSGFKLQHHAFLYSLYKKNPGLPLYGYCEELERYHHISVSEMFIKRWFDAVGPYKGSLRKTSNFPHKKDAVENLVRLCDYLELISAIPDHSKLVFTDKKPMKECMIFPLVRGDHLTGERPTNKSRANSKN